MENEIKNKFTNWIMKIGFMFLESPLFQPIGLELSCTNIIIETKEDYSLNEIEKSDIAEELYPLAFYNPIDDSIHIFVEHASFLKRETDQEKFAFLMMILFHEAAHRLLQHIKRGKDKDSWIWNIAADMEVHNTLYVYNEVMVADQTIGISPIFSNMKNYINHWLFLKDNENMNEGLFDKAYLQNIAEEIYNDLFETKEETSKEVDVNLSGLNRDGEGSGGSESEDDNGKDSNGVSVKITVKTVKTKSGKEFTYTNVEFPPNAKPNLTEEQQKERENGEITRKTLMENSLQKYAKDAAEINRGNMPSECKTFLKKLFHVKIDWKKILRSSLVSTLETSEYFSWLKPRTSLFAMPGNLYLPSQCEDESSYGTLIVARDESGSITDDMCSQAASIIMEAKEYYKKIIVLKHDVIVKSVDSFDEMNDNVKKALMTRVAAGGTSHRDVFEWIKKYDKENKDEEKISCCIFITDLFSDIEETQDIISERIPRIYLYPSIVKQYIEDHKKKIVGKFIEIE